MKIIGIHQPQYLPWLGLLDRVIRCDEFVVLDNVAYSKNYFYNRNKIKTNSGSIWLTVPVVTKGHMGQAFIETRIDNSQAWGIKHSKSIYYAYGSAPFYKDYSQSLQEILREKREFLDEICIETFIIILSLLGVKTKIMRASELKVKGRKEELLINICKKVGATHYLSGPDGKNYLNNSHWEENDIRVDFQRYNHPAYPQLHGGFIPNLSVIDLLFNCGNDSLSILTSGQPEYFKGQK